VARVPSSGFLHRYFWDRRILVRALRVELKRARQEGARPRLVAGWRRWETYIVARGASSVALRVELSASILAAVLLWTFLPMAVRVVMLVALAMLAMGIWPERLASWIGRISERPPDPPSAVWNQTSREPGTPMDDAPRSDSGTRGTGREPASSSQHRADARARADRARAESQARRRECRDRAETPANQSEPGEGPTPPVPRTGASEPGATQAAADGHRRGREKLSSRTGDARVLSLGPVIVGRELLMAGAAEASATECRLLLGLAADAFEAGVRHPDPNEYPFGRHGEAEADALMWAGIARGLLGDADRGRTHLERAFDQWQRIGDPIKSGRCAEELAELNRLGGQRGDEWFSRAETCFRTAGREDRLAMLRESRDGATRHRSSFLLRRPVNPQASTILGSSTAVEIRDRLVGPPPRDAPAMTDARSPIETAWNEDLLAAKPRATQAAASLKAALESGLLDLHDADWAVRSFLPSVLHACAARPVPSVPGADTAADSGAEIPSAITSSQLGWIALKLKKLARVQDIDSATEALAATLAVEARTRSHSLANSAAKTSISLLICEDGRSSATWACECVVVAHDAGATKVSFRGRTLAGTKNELVRRRADSVLSDPAARDSTPRVSDPTPRVPYEIDSLDDLRIFALEVVQLHRDDPKQRIEAMRTLSAHLEADVQSLKSPPCSRLVCDLIRQMAEQADDPIERRIWSNLGRFAESNTPVWDDPYASGRILEELKSAYVQASEILAASW
jgi:hypothetical protein